MLFVCTSGQPECPNIILIIYIIYIIYTTQCKLLERKYGICASGWKEKHHQRKLEWVKPPRVQVEYLCQLLREKHHHHKWVPVTTTVRTRCKGQGARCKGQDQLSASRSGMQQQHATPITTTTDQFRISTGAGGVHNAAIIVTCVRVHSSNFLGQGMEEL